MKIYYKENGKANSARRELRADVKQKVKKLRRAISKILVKQF